MPPPALRYASLDLWRGVACLLVVIYHSTRFATDDGPLAWLQAASWYGQHGVTIFFVISGYCITAAVVGGLERGLTWTDYTKRRIRRILPPYWVAMACTAALVLIAQAAGVGHWWTAPIPHGGPETVITPWLHPWQWAGNLTLTETWRVHFIKQVGTGWLLGTAWTLCYEEQFYAVLGGLFALSGVLKRPIVVQGVAVVTSLVLVIGLLPPEFSMRVSGTFVDAWWLAFAAGVGVFYGIRTQRPWMIAGLLAGLCGFIWMFLPYGQQIFIALGFAGLLLPLARWDRGFYSALPALRWCGTRSYSIYLVHWPLTKGLSAVAATISTSQVFTWTIVLPVCLIVTLVTAAWFFRLVESRFLNSRVTAGSLGGATPVVA